MSNDTIEIIHACRRDYDLAKAMESRAISLPAYLSEPIQEAAFIILAEVDGRYRDGRLCGSLATSPSSSDPIYLAGYAHELLAVAGAYPHR